MNDTTPKNDKIPVPVDSTWLDEWLTTIRKDLDGQTKLLKSIKSTLQFLVIMFILSGILGACVFFMSVY